MKKKEQLRRLILNRETIRCLDEPKLGEVVGGAGAVVCPTDSLTRTGEEGGG